MLAARAPRISKPRQSEIAISSFKTPRTCGTVTFRPAPGFTGEATAQVTEEVTRLLPLCRTPQSREDLMRQLGLGHREHFRKAYMLPALEASLLERTHPGEATEQ